MTEEKAIYNTYNRDASGQFTYSSYGDKKIRSMKLTDHAWNTLDAMARERGMTRTDIIEEFTRASFKRQIVLEALARFIEFKKDSYGNNPMQRGKQFNMNARTWDALREFLKFAELD